eukprot:COSAG01_NODE_1613_length_9731_cov_11.760590_8_plen_392_part_00
MLRLGPPWQVQKQRKRRRTFAAKNAAAAVATAGQAPPPPSGHNTGWGSTHEAALQALGVRTHLSLASTHARTHAASHRPAAPPTLLPTCHTRRHAHARTWHNHALAVMVAVVPCDAAAHVHVRVPWRMSVRPSVRACIVRIIIMSSSRSRGGAGAPRRRSSARGWRRCARGWARTVASCLRPGPAARRRARARPAGSARCAGRGRAAGSGPSTPPPWSRCRPIVTHQPCALTVAQQLARGGTGGGGDICPCACDEHAERARMADDGRPAPPRVPVCRWWAGAGAFAGRRRVAGPRTAGAAAGTTRARWRWSTPPRASSVWCVAAGWLSGGTAGQSHSGFLLWLGLSVCCAQLGPRWRCSGCSRLFTRAPAWEACEAACVGAAAKAPETIRI